MLSSMATISADELIAIRRAQLQQRAAQEKNEGAKSAPSPSPSSSRPEWAQKPKGEGDHGRVHLRCRPLGVVHSAVGPINVKGSPQQRLATVIPKVMSPIQHVRGELKTSEMIHRKRQRYEESLPLEMLLEAKGVPANCSYSSAEPGTYHTLLPLEAFDDEDYEEWTPEDWLLKKSEDKDQIGVPCKVFRLQNPGYGEWQRAKVVEYDRLEGAFSVQFLKEKESNGFPTLDGSPQLIPRIYIFFDAESPTNFVERFTSAYRRRKMAEGIMRAELFVEYIPSDDFQMIDPNVLERIRYIAVSTPKLLESESNLDVQGFLEEIAADYKRTMNYDLFSSHTKDGGLAHLLGNADIPSPMPPPPVKQYGVDVTRSKRFAEITKAFRATSFLPNHSCASALLSILRRNSTKVLSHRPYLFDPELESHRPCSLIGFDDLQSVAVRDNAEYFQDHMILPLLNTAKSMLSSFSKEDELYLLFVQAEEYQGSKTQRFFSSINHEMENVLRNVILGAIESFTRFITRAGNFTVTIQDLITAQVEEGEHSMSTEPFGFDHRVTERFLRTSPYTQPSLLKVNLIIDRSKLAKKMTERENEKNEQGNGGTDGEEDDDEDPSISKKRKRSQHKEGEEEEGEKELVISYSSTTDHIGTMLNSLVKRCLSSFSDLRSIESRLFEFPACSFIQGIRAEDPHVVSCLQRIDSVLQRVRLIMNEYIELYRPYNDIAALDVKSYIEKFEERFPRTRGVQDEIKMFLSRQQEVLGKIPSEINLGFVVVECADLRRTLSSTCSIVASQILDAMALRARKKAEEINDKFTDIYNTLNKPTETPEEVVSVKDFIKLIPEQVFDLNVMIQETREIHEVLDHFHRVLSEDEFNKKWRAYGWPSQLDDAVNQRTQELEEIKRCIVATMNRNQEMFEKEVEQVQQIVEAYHQHCNAARRSEIASDVRTVLKKIQQLRDQANTFNTHENLFNLEKSDYAAVHSLATDFEPYANLWLTIDKWELSIVEWEKAKLTSIDAEELEQRVGDMYKAINKATRDTHLTVELINIALRTRERIEKFKLLVPTIKFLRTEGMQTRHWDHLSKELGIEVRPGDTLSYIKDIDVLHLRDHSDVLMNVAEIAAREHQIEVSLKKMKSAWEDLRWKVKAHKDTGSFVASKDVVDEIQEKLDDQTLITQSIAFSPFKKIFEEEIADWEASLKLVQDVIDQWLVCQKSWMYLEPIFQSEDISRQLPQEYKRFQVVNKNWKFLSNQAHEIDLVMNFCKNTENCWQLLKENNQILEVVEHGLNQYLENKRASFARFYFLSDDELLTILSEARDPQKIQPHFRKLFENVSKIEMVAPENEMFGLYSHMKEYIPFSQPILPRKYVENWLMEIEYMMKVSIRAQLDKGIKDFAALDRKDFILHSSGQVAIAVNQIMWTHECEESLREFGSLQPYVPKAQENLMELVKAVRQKLTNLQRMNLSGLITIEVHARDIVDHLAAEKVDSVLAFEWVSQLRSYWENNDCFLRQVEAQFRYGGEYLGNTTRLVITPLTDRIYLTLTGAMHMFLGGAPAGPAGTGKTETVKDLAKAVAKQCVVFNCQEGMTYASMGKFFKGLAQAGAWACFDEFNRIDVEVLSVVAQQVSSLQEAARSKQYRIPFEGTEILVDPSYSVFITMNPGYAGRTELPDNLKVLFRPVACMVPDYAMIAEIRLFSFGYSDSRKLSQKMVATFRLSSEQLSSQDHYDFGMRAVNTVISAAGLMKRENPDMPEDQLLLRALRDSNAPKFLEEDLLLFSGIISDLFPGVDLKPADYASFQDVLTEKCATNGLQPTDRYIKKCIQIYEMSILRHGQMTVGPTMGGKTSATKVLQEAMTKLRLEMGNQRFEEVKTHTLNPKAITMSQLYGGFDDASGEWKDGLIGELFRIAARDTTEARQWIIFDGPVDALWIESMNTVLDENKKLCLISGEIITMTPFMNCWFEVEDLAVASPATVSRAGMIYMEPDGCIGVINFIRSWVMYRLPKTLDPYKEHLQELCGQLFPPLIHFVRTQVTEYNRTVWPNLVSSCFNIFDCFLPEFTPTRTYEVPQDKLDLLREVYLHFLIFSIVWSFGSTGDKPSRNKFDKFLRDELRLRNVNVELPVIGMLQDYEFIVDERRWVPWTDRLPPFTEQVTQTNMADIIVPTPDVARYKYINQFLLTHSFHTLCVGPTGTGKTVLLNQLLMYEMPKDFTPIFFTFSARTSANQTQDLIFSKFEVRRRASPQIWGAPVNKKFVVMIDDMNMPLKEQYGAQPPIEILRQYMDYSGWYDRRTREFFYIADVIYVGAMGPPGGGRNTISQRFLRHFNQIAFPEVDDENMKRIFVSILESYFSPFNEDIRAKILPLVVASIEVFNTVLKELRPTPSRSHYLFNLRDVSKVMGGMVNATPKVQKTVASLVRLWIHEEMRTFRDRLVNTQDCEWFDKLLQKQVQKHFKISPEEVRPKNDGIAPTELLFVSFLGGRNEQRVYQEVPDFGALVKTIEAQMEDYNLSPSTIKLHLVMFSDAVQHVCRISRVISKPNGHVLLLGVGGSGRQSLTRLAAHINEYDLKQVEIAKGYTTNAWKEDIKAILRLVAFKSKQVLFLFTDTQIVHECMLEDMNNLLNAGEVPNLFLGQEFDDLLGTMKPICMAENLPLDKVNVYARFVKGCRANLHISLCMSPLGETFRNRLRMFPALVNCCTIDWFSAWPTLALQNVAHSFFASMPLVSGEDVDKCTEVCVKIHQSVEEMSSRFLQETRRHNYVTPTSFLELLSSFKLLLGSQTEENISGRNRLQNGLKKLRETENAIGELQQTLAQSQPILQEKAESIKALVKEMETQTASAEVTKREAQKEREEVAKMQAECAAIEDEAQGQLSEALPELDRALESLKNLKSTQITEVAGYKAPTGGVIMTMQGICVLFQIKPIMRAANPMEEKKPDYWITAKEQLLNNPNLLLQRLMNYDKEHIPEKLIQAVMPLVNSEDFTPKKIAGASQACAAMCQWTHAMVRFHEVNKKVEPLRQKLAVAQGANREAQRKLKEAEDRLEEVARTLAALQKKKETAEQEMQELEMTVEKIQLKLDRAAMLIDGLAGEKKNWTKTIEELQDNSQYLMGNMLAAAGQISYLGPFTFHYRRMLLNIWEEKLTKVNVLHSKHLSVFDTLQDPVQTREWGMNGLPMDNVSVENALFLTYARRWPLMIDPQTQANKWIRSTYKDSLEVIKPQQKDMLKRIEYCIRTGRCVLLENIGEEVSASLNPLLLKQTFYEAGQEMIRVSDAPIPWNPKFKFFMTTKLPNPHYIPEIMVQVTLLNFFITPQGLEDQLLGVVVGYERKELELRRSDLIQKNASMKADLANTQKTILRKLEEVQGDILDDVELIDYLNESKEKTTEIVAKVAEAEEAEVEINTSREEYRPIARHSSCLYFCCSTLSNVDPMYQYSLQWFVQLFQVGIDAAPSAEEVPQRLENLRDYFTFSFYQNISRSLFEKHKLMFSLFLTIRIMQMEDKIVDDEFRFLLQGPSIVEKAEGNPDETWLTASTWNELTYMSKHFDVFSGFAHHISENIEYYKKLFMSSSAHTMPLLGEWEEKLSPMQKMMFIRCLRPDKLMEAVQLFVTLYMGERFIRPPPFDLLTSFKDSTCTTPLIFILSQGADPYEDWRKFAETQQMSKKLFDISLGQGQGPRAERMVQEGMEHGAWVLLQNCHLATSWMPTLDRIVESMNPVSVHPSFRLWLTSMPSADFPAAVLQNGVKMTNEPPKGMQANVARSILSYSNEYLDMCRKPVEFKKLFFSLSFFHALIQERRKFGALGWNIAYEYTSGDLSCCIAQIKMFLDKYSEVPYKVIKELSGNIHYGGRVTDDWDRRTLTTILEAFVTPEVMTDDYSFSSRSEYTSIPVTNQQGYLEHVMNWPINTHPEVFGLHENADITCARNETYETLAAITLLQGEASSTSGAGRSPDEVVSEMAEVINRRITAPFDIDKFRKRYPTKYEDSMNTVLVQEAIRFNRLIQAIHSALENLPLAIKGEVVMSKELEDMYHSIYINQVPSFWSNVAYPSLKSLAAWVDDLVLRLEMIQRWYDQGHPKVYWISGFFFPQAFLTGILQNTARKLQISIDTISYDFEWRREEPDSITTAPEAGCYIYGMFMEGARIDPVTLLITESQPKVLFEQVPMLWLKPQINRTKPTIGIYDCPLYKTVRRAGTLSTTGHSTNYVLTAEIPTSITAKHWIKRGVAMVCSLSS